MVEGEFVPRRMRLHLSCLMPWQTMPDDALLELAHDGQLEPEVIAGQVERLLIAGEARR